MDHGIKCIVEASLQNMHMRNIVESGVKHTNPNRNPNTSFVYGKYPNSRKK
jgi:hypothetical protein